MSFETARNAFAAQITNNVLYSTFAFPPPIPQVNSVVIEPAEPYIVSTNNKYSLAATLRLNVRMYVPLFDNQGNLAQLETLAADVRSRILDATQNVGDLSQPQVVSLETGDLLTAYFPTELIVNWSA